MGGVDDRSRGKPSGVAESAEFGLVDTVRSVFVEFNQSAEALLRRRIRIGAYSFGESEHRLAGTTVGLMHQAFEQEIRPVALRQLYRLVCLENEREQLVGEWRSGGTAGSPRLGLMKDWLWDEVYRGLDPHFDNWRAEVRGMVAREVFNGLEEVAKDQLSSDADDTMVKEKVKALALDRVNGLLPTNSISTQG
jgi:hypothetical protein